MSVKRPRISPNITAAIDGVRGSVPYERWVNDSLAEYLLLFTRSGVPRPAPVKGLHEVLWNLLSNDWYQLDWKEFERDIERVRELWQEEMDEQAIDAEHEEP